MSNGKIDCRYHMTEETVQRLMDLTMGFAHAYSFVIFDTMLRRKLALESALRKALAERTN